MADRYPLHRRLWICYRWSYRWPAVRGMSRRWAKSVIFVVPIFMLSLAKFFIELLRPLWQMFIEPAWVAFRRPDEIHRLNPQQGQPHE